MVSSSRDAVARKGGPDRAGACLVALRRMVDNATMAADLKLDAWRKWIVAPERAHDALSLKSVRISARRQADVSMACFPTVSASASPLATG